MEDVDRRGKHRYLWQHHIQSSGGKLILYREAHELRNANPFDDGFDQRLSIVAIEGAAGYNPRAVRKSECLWPAAQ